MIDSNKTIAEITAEGIKLIEETSIRNAIQEAYRSSAAIRVLETSQVVLERLVSSTWESDRLATFLAGWRATHGTALYVSGLVIRILREAEKTRSSANCLLYRAAGEMGEIIAEDTGVDDTPHNELFTRFANHIVGDDRWQLQKYGLPRCNAFRTFVKNTRLSGPIEDAILMTAASESWNSGEYSYLDPLAKSWLNNFPDHNNGLIDAAAYISHHSGDVELGHFLHAIKSWILYCKGVEKVPDPFRAKLVFEKYFQELYGAFVGLESALS